MGSGFATVDSAVASYTSGTWVDSSHRQILLKIIYYYLFEEKMKIKIKRPGKAHLKKNVTNVCLPFDSDQTLVPW